jgi:hypothetical protein
MCRRRWNGSQVIDPLSTLSLVRTTPRPDSAAGVRKGVGHPSEGLVVRQKRQPGTLTGMRRRAPCSAFNGRITLISCS